MPRKHTIATFLLALVSFLAAGAGLVLLVKPHVLNVSGGPAGRGADPAQQRGPAITATPDAGEYQLVDGLTSLPRPGEPNRLVIPSIDLDATVVEVGITVENGKPVWDTAAFAVGYHRGTALPGTRGNTVLAGHISSPVSKKGDVFRRLPEVRVGDRVDVYVNDQRFAYEVAQVKIVPPTAVEVMNPTPDPTLTLITCYPDHVYTSRLVVVARPLSGQARG